MNFFLFLSLFLEERNHGSLALDSQKLFHESLTSKKSLETLDSPPVELWFTVPTKKITRFHDLHLDFVFPRKTTRFFNRRVLAFLSLAF